MLWDVCWCLGFQLFHTLYGRARLCVILHACLDVLLFLCVYVCEVRLGWGLLLWFSGSARGVGVTFSPAWAPSAGPWGQLSPGLFAGSWSSAGLGARRPQSSVEGEDQGSSQGAAAHLLQNQRPCLLRHTSLKYFVLKTTTLYLASKHVHNYAALLKDSGTQ